MMIGDFGAGSLLRAALKQYAAACSGMAQYCVSDSALEGIPHEILDVILGGTKLLDSYQTNLEQAKAAIDQTRSRIPKTALINTLPTDILSYVFSLAVDSQPCRHGSPDRHQTPRVSPETLSHVCSHWREIAVHSRPLWRHVDFALTKGYPSNQLLLERAATFAARANPVPLDIHIVGRPMTRSRESIAIDPEAQAFCSSVVSRARSINLPGQHPFHIYQPIVCDYFKGGAPGTLTELVTTGNHRANFLSFGGMSQSLFSPDSQSPDYLSRAEEHLLPIRILGLVGVHFHWDSQAYHGLVELRLAPLLGSSGFSITRPQLAKILLSSPHLRALELGLEIVDSAPQETSNEGVKLQDLEILDLRSTRCTHYDTILRLISPGSKPLRVSLAFTLPHFPLLFNGTTRDFLNHTNTAHLHVESTSPEWLDLFEMVQSLHVPQLEALSLAGFALEDHQDYHPLQPTPHETHSIGAGGPKALPGCSRLESLHLASCDVNLDYLHGLVKKFPIRMLKMTNCSVSSDAGGKSPAKDWANQIRKRFPMIELCE